MSNTAVPWSSNTSIYGSNTSYWSSNTAIPWNSNLSVTNSNVLYSNIPWKLLGSNVYLQTSNVGINVTVPAYPFHVNGKIYGTSQYLASNDTAAIPSFTWITTSNTGIFSPATNIVGVSTNGTERIRIDTSNIVIANDVMLQAQIYGSNDTSNIPTYSWSNNSNTGLYQPLTNIIGFATNGIERMRIDTLNTIIGTKLVLQNQIVASNDTSNLPAYSWSNDSNTGMFQPAANQIAFALNGASSIQFVDSNAQFSSNVTVNSNLIVRGVNYNYGRECYYVENLPALTTASATPAARMAISNMLEGGTYQIWVSTLTATTTASRYTVSRVAVSNANGAAQVFYASSNACAIATREFSVCYHVQSNLPAGSNIITLQWSADGGSTASIRQSSMTVLRIR